MLPAWRLEEGGRQLPRDLTPRLGFVQWVGGWWEENEKQQHWRMGGRARAPFLHKRSSEDLRVLLRSICHRVVGTFKSITDPWGKKINESPLAEKKKKKG